MFFCEGYLRLYEHIEQSNALNLIIDHLRMDFRPSTASRMKGSRWMKGYKPELQIYLQTPHSRLSNVEEHLFANNKSKQKQMFERRLLESKKETKCHSNVCPDVNVHREKYGTLE